MPSTLPTYDAPDVRSEPAEPSATRALPRRRVGRGVVTAAVATLAVASLLVAALVWHAGAARHDHLVAAHRAGETARTAAADAARAAATAVLSYDYRHFGADVARAEGYLTGKLRSDYDTLQRRMVEPTARQVHASVQASVKGVAVVTATPDAATVLVFVDQLSRNSKLSAPRLDQDRVRMQLVNSGGHWLVSAFEAL